MGRNHDPTDKNDSEPNEHTATVPHADSVTNTNVKTGSDTSTEHTKPFQLEHPVEGVEDLYGSEYGQYLLREAQVADGVAPGDRSQTREHRVEESFDLRVIDITRRVLRFPETDANSEELPIGTNAVLAVVLHRARSQSLDEFTSHVNEQSEVRDELGIDGDVDESTILGWEELLTEADTEAVEACATRVLYAVYRSGQAFPEQVWNAAVAGSGSPLLTSDDKERIGDGKIPVDTTREALRNWAREFLEACIQDEFSLGRDQSQTEYSVMSIVGVFAHAALQSRTLTDASKTCSGWYTDPELVPDRTTLMEPIKRMGVDEIAALFERVNHRFLEFANAYTILRGSKDLAFDPTSVPIHAGDESDRWIKGYAQPLKRDVDPSEADQQWEFGVAAVTEADVRFSLGLYPIKKKYGDDEQDRQSVTAADVASRLLRSTRLDTPVSVNGVTMDRGLSGAELIKRCRETVGDNWAVLGKQDEGEPSELVANTPETECRFEKLEEYFSDLSNKPNAFIVPAPENGDSEHSQWIFFTDLPKETFLTETEGGEKVLDKQIVISRYQNRARIEKTLQQVKHDFNIPVRDGTHTRIKYFNLNMSMLFYNLHNLIINSISPKHGLPLGKTRGATNGQVLSAIREVAFELADEENPDR